MTIARAIELKHAPGLIAALAYETANFYQKAGKLRTLGPCFEILMFLDLLPFGIMGNRLNKDSDCFII